MTWTVDVGTAVTTWVRTQAPAVPLVAYIVRDWLKDLCAHGPYAADEVGSVVFADEGTGLVVLSLDHVEFPQVFVEMRVRNEARSVSLLSVSTGYPGPR